MKSGAGTEVALLAERLCPDRAQFFEQRRWDCENSGAASCGRPPLMRPPARLPAESGGRLSPWARWSNRFCELAVLSLVVSGCAGDGTGLDESGRPISSLVITVSDTILALPAGATFGLTAEVRDRQGNLTADQTVMWSSGNPGVASVAMDGTVTAIAPGAAVIAASADDAEETTRVAVVASATLSGDVQPIFSTAGCVNSGCHSGAQPQAGQNLTPGQAFANTVDVASVELPSMDRVEPGDPERSYLVHKIQGTHLTVGGSGDQMPLGLGMLAQQQIDVIRAWIRMGAANN